MTRNIVLIVCFVVGMLSMGIDAKAQIISNPSFESQIGNFVTWSQSLGDSDVIDSQGITPNVTPTDGSLMAYLASSGDFVDGEPYNGGGFETLATDQLINTGIAETNSSVVVGINIVPSGASIISYDVSFLAPSDAIVGGCDNYAAVLLVHNDFGNNPTIEDAKCYNNTGIGFIDTNNGAVPCTQVGDDDTAYSIGPYQFAGGMSDFFSDSVSAPALESDRYSLHLVTGQIDDGVCDQTEISADTGALFDNFKVLTLNSLDPSQAGVQNTLSATGFTPDGDVTFVFSFNNNTPADVSTRVAPDDICEGLDTPLVNPRIISTVQADGAGDASINVNIPLSLEGINAFVQAIDLTTCIGSNVNEETIGSPPVGETPVLEPLDPGTAGQQNVLSATNATPNSDVRFIWSFNQGSVAANDICPGFQSGIINPRTLPLVQSDGAGVATLNVNVPANLAGVSVVLQAVDITTCTGSNVNEETL